MHEHARLKLARLLLHDALLHLRPESADEALDWPRGRVAKRADSVPLDLRSDLVEHVDLLDLGVTCHHAVHDLVHPRRPLAARGALAAALVSIELGQPADGRDHVCGLVEDSDSRCSQARASCDEGVEVHQHVVASLLGQDRHGRAARDHAEQVVPATTHATAVLLQQVAQRDAHLLLDGDRVVHVTRDAEELRAGVVLAAEAGEPVTTAAHDRWCHRNGLNVGHRRRAAVQPGVGRKWGLEARLAGLSLERLEQAGLLATDVRAATAVDVHVEVFACATRVLADEPRLVRLRNGALEASGLVHKLAADVDVRRARAHARARDQAALDKLVGVMAHNLAVFARSRLRLVRVHHEVLRLLRIVLGHERPLQARREASTTATAKPGALDLSDDLVSTEKDDVLRPVPIAALLRAIEPRAAVAVQVGEDPILVLQVAVHALCRAERPLRCNHCSPGRREARCTTRRRRGSEQHA
eukprot:CAMPEP_0119406326 /NCGR_PEP_ID=MMETSP1335-20130426/696_1 /TAXON_ID=259385 /ORGANISM="Chrysoculter rhomboideus, Strain RCC1486" /LENGTH=470 /DNA_ID=CAMNT_0007430399 /DNA_START=300 /DNA_END=1708 /DNA_ORIENTATION=+